MNIFQSYRSFWKAISLVVVIAFLFLTTSWSQNTPLKTVNRPTAVSAAPQGVIAFRAAATYVSGEPVASNTENKVDFTGSYFDESKNFSVATDEFIAPADGIYHFDLRVSWAQFSAPGMVTLLIRTNLYSQIAITTILPSSTTQLFDSNLSSLAKLKAGDKVSVYLQQNSGTQQHYRQVVFGGFKVN
jgi:hypothetical protein